MKPFGSGTICRNPSGDPLLETPTVRLRLFYPRDGVAQIVILCERHADQVLERFIVKHSEPREVRERSCLIRGQRLWRAVARWHRHLRPFVVRSDHTSGQNGRSSSNRDIGSAHVSLLEPARV
jgi:hypothetical protein